MELEEINYLYLYLYLYNIKPFFTCSHAHLIFQLLLPKQGLQKCQESFKIIGYCTKWSRYVRRKIEIAKVEHTKLNIFRVAAHI
jgi:hypothetical protein